MKHKHHIIPKYMGGSDDPLNLIELTVEDHAEAHKKLYDLYGNWQDFVAWQGLAKLDENFNAAQEAIKYGARKGAATANADRKDKTIIEIYGKEKAEKARVKMQQAKSKRDLSGQSVNNKKQYEITLPSGRTEVVIGLRGWCIKHGFKPEAFATASLRGNKTHDGFSVKRI